MRKDWVKLTLSSLVERYQQNYRITFEEIGCSGGFELSMIVLLNRMADTINQAIEATDDSV